MTRRPRIIAFAFLAAVLTLAGCGSSTPTAGVIKDQRTTNGNLQGYEANQPTPYCGQSCWSQYRQTVIDVEQAEIHGVATTTFFYNQGSAKPIKSCSSIGFPVAATAQLTNPEQVVGIWSGSQYGTGTVGQQEPNGVYTGPTDGTYVVCVGAGGVKRIDYWEGHVETEGGSAHIGTDGQTIVDEGQTTVASTPHK